MLHPWKLALAGGTVWGICLFCMTLLNIYFDYGTSLMHLLVDLYPGFSISWAGASIALLWGVLDMGVFLYLIAWIHNKL